MKLTSGEPSDFELIPEGDAIGVRLLGVEQRNFEWEGQPVEKLRWSFAVTDAGPWQGKTIYGETSTAFTAHPNCKAYNWVKVLTGREYEPGEDLDTDELLGLPALAVVRHKPGKDGRKWMRVRELLRLNSSQPAPSEAPF